MRDSAFHDERRGMLRVELKELGYSTLWILGLTVVIVAVSAASDQRDFIEYWSATKLLVAGGNPYDPVELLKLQVEVQPEREVPLMMWNPPWTFSILLPLSLFSFKSAGVVWFSTMLLLTFISATIFPWSKRGTKLSPIKSFLGLLIFFPVVLCLAFSQTGIILLLAVSLSCYFFEQKKDFLAGISLSFLLIKPHLFLLFFIYLLIHFYRLDRNRWILGVVVSIIIQLLIAHAFNPSVLPQWIEALSGQAKNFEAIPATDWRVSTIGSLIQELFSNNGLEILAEKSRGTFSLFGILVCSYLFLKNQKFSSLKEALIPVLCLSFIFAPFAWPFDFACLGLAHLLVAKKLWDIGAAPLKITKTMAPLLSLSLIPYFLIPIGWSMLHHYFWFPVLFLFLYSRAEASLLK